MQSISSVVKISTNESRACDVCGTWIDTTADFAKSVNHYLSHGYRIVHIGQETVDGTEGLWQTTVAVLGKPA
jgi:hypothetical protein